MRFVRFVQANTNKAIWVNPAQVTSFQGRQVMMVGQPEPVREETRLSMTNGGTVSVLGKPESVLILLDGER